MAQLWVRDGMDPEAPDAVVVAVVVDPAGTAEERAVAALFSYAYDGDGTFLLVRTDGWAERRVDGDVLTVEIVVHRAVLDALGIDGAGFPERPLVRPDAVRLLRVSTPVVGGRYDRALDVTAVLSAPAGAAAEQIVADVHSGEAWPLILAPPPPTAG
ncbi:hypothetical protein [Streptomyces gilvus]|uniref:hypothetical protein n=1 Tax=Streptomyces gilvus TaxID=2920937 RepID=UPI001F0DD5F5|nr:hypothetical protein [Streptomyces sp. CME 23]MCH5675893.1 hypothetical protein [Streptomyces sp. CME 23]